jgi:GNAT superfamily N-acetyltransferase
MSFTVRQLNLDEIPMIGQIDNSDVVNAQYVCALEHDGLGLSLRRASVEPPEQIPKWSERELVGRYALWQRNAREEGAVFHGAFVGDKLVGVSLVARLSDGQSAELYAIHVDRATRRQGIGTALLDRAESQCKAWGCTRLLVYTSFKASSLDFYRARGYCVIGIQDPSVKTKNFDLTLLKKLT